MNVHEIIGKEQSTRFWDDPHSDLNSRIYFFFAYT